MCVCIIDMHLRWKPVLLFWLQASSLIVTAMMGRLNAIASAKRIRSGQQSSAFAAEQIFLAGALTAEV